MMKKLLAVLLIACAGMSFKAGAFETFDINSDDPSEVGIVVSSESMARVTDRDITISNFMSKNSKMFKACDLMYIEEQLKKMTDDQLQIAYSMHFVNPVLNEVLSIVVGSFGVDRFLIDQIGLGILKLVTCGGFGVWTVIDWFIIMNKTREFNFRKFMEVAGTTSLPLPVQS